MVAARTMTGHEQTTAFQLDQDPLRAAMAREPLTA
jgi:hypothetical protein